MSSQLLAPTSHLHTARQNSQGRLNHRQGTGLDLESSVQRDSRAECTSGLWFRLSYSQSETPQTTNTFRRLFAFVLAFATRTRISSHLPVRCTSEVPYRFVNSKAG